MLDIEVCRHSEEPEVIDGEPKITSCESDPYVELELGSGFKLRGDRETLRRFLISCETMVDRSGRTPLAYG